MFLYIFYLNRKMLVEFWEGSWLEHGHPKRSRTGPAARGQKKGRDHSREPLSSSVLHAHVLPSERLSRLP